MLMEKTPVISYLPTRRWCFVALRSTIFAFGPCVLIDSTSASTVGESKHLNYPGFDNSGDAVPVKNGKLSRSVYHCVPIFLCLSESRARYLAVEGP